MVCAWLLSVARARVSAMSTHETAWPAGTPCWVELSADDPAAANAFYASLFGWDIEVSGPEFGGYGVARVDGHRVAGIGGKMGGDATDRRGRPTWPRTTSTRPPRR